MMLVMSHWLWVEMLSSRCAEAKAEVQVSQEIHVRPTQAHSLCALERGCDLAACSPGSVSEGASNVTPGAQALPQGADDSRTVLDEVTPDQGNEPTAVDSSHLAPCSRPEQGEEVQLQVSGQLS